MIGWIIGGVAFFYLFNLSTTGFNLRYDVIGIAYTGNAGINPQFRVSMRFINPRQTKIILNSLFFEVFTPAGVKIGEITEPQINREIAGNSSTNIDFTFEISTLTATQAIWQIITSKTLPSPLRFLGHIRANSILIPIDYNYTLSTPLNKA